MLDAIEVLHVTHAYGGKPPIAVLEDVSIAVERGAFVSIVGPSGCGKSSLLRMLAGLLVPASGTVRICGQDTEGRSDLVAYMPQRDLLLPWRRAWGNAVLGAQVCGVDRAALNLEAGRLFERFGLGGFERAWPAQLSGGMRQRLALLRTFLMPRDTLLLDEPFGALDAMTRRQMHDWLQDVWHEDGRSVLFVTHDIEEALILSDVVYVLSARPARVVLRLPVPLPRPRRSQTSTTAEFIALKDRLLRALDTQTAGA